MNGTGVIVGTGVLGVPDGVGVSVGVGTHGFGVAVGVPVGVGVRVGCGVFVQKGGLGHVCC